MRRARDEDELPLSRVRPVDEDVRRELEFHLEQRTQELIARGMPAEQARAAARDAFGDRDAVESECRTIESRRRASRRRSRRLEAFAQDVRLGFRVLRKSPGFAFAAILTIALGIGANTAVFSIVNAIILQPLPYEKPDRLVRMLERHEKGWANIPWSNFLDIEAQSRSFTGLASYGSGTSTLLGAGAPQRVKAGWISKGFFRVFPVRPVLGRLPSPDEHAKGANPVAVVSHSFWRNQLGAPASLAGVRVKLGMDHEVIGVLPPGFDFPNGNQVWRPLELMTQSVSRTSHNWDVVGRMASGVTVSAAQRDVDALLVRLKPLHYPDFDATGSIVTPLQESLTANARRPLYLLLGASALLLLGACANLASAMLARGMARSAEVAVRSALGATRLRIIRQLLTESALLAVLGCAAGLALATLLLRSLKVLAPASIRLDEVHIDGWVLGFAAVVAVVTALLFGLLPALRLAEADTASMLRGTRGSADGGRVKAWNMLVIVEVAMAVVLLAGAALLTRSFSRVMQTDLGFDPERVLAVEVNLPAINYGDSSRTVSAFQERVLASLRTQPGIEAAGFANIPPMGGNGQSGAVWVEGKPLDPRGPFNAYALYRVIGGDFFRAMGIPLISGRTFGPGDDVGAPSVVIVNETFARNQWPNEDPIGKRLRVSGMDGNRDEPWATVIGVVGDVRSGSVTEEFRETNYYDHRQRPPYRSRSVTWAVRSTVDPAAMAPLVRRTIASVDPQVPIEIRPARELITASVADRRFTMLLIAGFAAVALFLAVIGIYSVVSYTVAQRTREIGIRLALGAMPGEMRWMVVATAMRTVIPGLALGTLLALASSGTLRSLLYGVSPFEPLSLAGAVAVLGLAATASCIVPALRATRVDPMIAIRAE